VGENCRDKNNKKRAESQRKIYLLSASACESQNHELLCCFEDFFIVGFYETYAIVDTKRGE
jgi:hypothetical protein